MDSVELTPLPAGEEGEVVLTTLGKEGMPLLRYRTRDLSRIYPDPCPCGSPYPRMARLSGRTSSAISAPRSTEHVRAPEGPPAKQLLDRPRSEAGHDASSTHGQEC
ncbi:MAG: hypothetical protein GEU81_10180 [Nitriliruptorales bacterium]|nr:hypothetical protein [Nitriliruptorales bacterium]